MLIEQLDQNKIKVTVDASDQEKYGVTYESMTYSDCNTRRLCESIMEKAKREIGFNVSGEKLLVEARKSTDGAVTLFLSKITTSLLLSFAKMDATNPEAPPPIIPILI